MADEFNFLWSETQNYIAEADTYLIPVSGQLERYGRCRYGGLLSPCVGVVYLLLIQPGDGRIGVTLQMQRHVSFLKN